MTGPQDPTQPGAPDGPTDDAWAAELSFDEDGQLVGGPGEGAADAGGAVGGDIAALSGELAELTGDLQRLQADYTNYRRRVERDREQVRELAVSGALAELLPVLDDIGRARAHDELTGAFRSVGEALEQAVAKLGLESFGAVGEPFDPSVHEALSHVISPDVTETTCVEVYQPGYRFAGRVVRPARVVVADPANPT